MIDAYQAFVNRNRRWVLIGMLLILHIALMRDVGSLWTRALMVAHFGLFILWQPFLRVGYRLTAGQIVGIAAVCTGIALWLNWWLVILWIAALAGVVGGKVFLFRTRWLRVFYLLVLTYLISLLLIWVTPQVFPHATLSTDLIKLIQLGLTVLFALMVMVPVEAESAEDSQTIDFFYSILLFLLLVVLVLGSFTLVSVKRIEYVMAVAYTLLSMASVLLLLSWAWNPRAGFGGLSVFFSRYLLTIGLPFEQWLHFLADLSQQEREPDKFLHEAFAGLSKLPWVIGGAWHSDVDGTAEFGLSSPHTAEFVQNPQLKITLYTSHALSPALSWHFNLLGQLLVEFYVAKQREQKLRQQSYVQAVHETGARLTHDVKNLLQSLNALCAAAQHEEEDNSPELQALMRRQLPVVSQRLQNTLEKLQKPQTDSGQFILASAWWANLQRSYEGRQVEFLPTVMANDIPLPQSLFDSVADNLLQNALSKTKVDKNIKIQASWHCGDKIEFRVKDTGAAMNQELMKKLFHAPMTSPTGLGIGLYQAARHAEFFGFKLELEKNVDGEVCFVLSGALK